MTTRWRVLALNALAIVLIATPATAGGSNMFGYGPHTQNVGFHWILDAPGPDPEYGAVSCTYPPGGGKLKSMRIKQPVMFADVHLGDRTQKIGWRAIIQWATTEQGPWHQYGMTPKQSDTASGKWPADFRPVTFSFPSTVGQHDWYRVEYRFFWYAGNGTLADAAVHRPEWYRVIQGGFSYEGACPWEYTPQVTVSDGTDYGEGPHSGLRGLHWYLDTDGPNPEFPAVRCEYDASSKLDKVIIRRPIVFARDTTSGVDRQDVGWRAVLQSTPTNDTSEVWTDVSSTPLVRRRATDTLMADFLPQALEVGPPGGPIIAYRVVYRLFWYTGSGAAIGGRATHIPRWYELLYDGGLGSWHERLCYSDGSG